MIENERLIQFFKRGILNEEGKDLLIKNLLHPEQEELQQELFIVCSENHACTKTECMERKKMKGHPVNCKDTECKEREFLLSDK